MNYMLIVFVLALGFLVARHSIADQENDSEIVDFDYTGSVVETNAMTAESGDPEINPHQEGYDGLPMTRQGSSRSYTGQMSSMQGRLYAFTHRQECRCWR